MVNRSHTNSETSDSGRVSRRQLLAVASGAATVGLAGCSGEDPDGCRVEAVMTVPVEWIRADLWLEEAVAMMQTHGINHLPVRDRDGDYVGMVSSTDIREAAAGSGRG